MPTYPVEVLWCSNPRSGRSNGWSFPSKVRRKLIADFSGKRILHLFGGRAGFGTRLDVDPIVRPDVIGDAWLPPFASDSFDVVILDPPYITLNAQQKNDLLRAATWIATEKLIWFSTTWISSSASLSAERAWLVRCGDNRRVRCLQYFRVHSPKLGPVERFRRGPAMKYNRWLAQPESLCLEAVPRSGV